MNFTKETKTMVNNKAFKEIEDYVNDIVAAYACEIDNIESIRCARKTNDIYMELIHEDSTVRYFDITELDISSIGIMVGCIIANVPIKLEVTDRESKKEIRKIFKQVRFRWMD
jgi:hypothetical protein